MWPYAEVGLAAAGTVLLTTPLIRWLAQKMGAVDRPSDRKVHAKDTPSLGGLALLLGVAAGLGAARLNPALRATFADSSELQGTLLAAIVIVALGVVDDFRTLSVPAKVAGQILAAGVLILNGVQLLFVYFPSQGVISVGSDLAVPLTVIWVLVMVNAVNLIDGLDGLAAGITAIGAAGFFVYAYVGPSTFGAPVVTAAVLSVIVVGVGVGFLPWNFHPAWIFMGDSGSMLLGLLLASATISGVGHATLAPSGGDLAAFFIPILPLMILAVPMVDVGMAIVRRLRRGRPIFAPDKEHLHHQLRDLGHTHRQAVVLMYFWSALLAGTALAVTFINGRLVVGAIGGTAFFLIAATFVPARVRERRRKRAEALAAVGAEASRTASFGPDTGLLP